MKGSIIFDFLVIIIMVLVFSMTSIIGYQILSEFNETSEGLITSNTSINVTNTALTTVQGFDYIFVFIIFGMMICTVIGAFLLRTHPAFFIASLLGLIFVIILSGQISNIFLEFAVEETVIDYASSFPLMVQIWQNIPLIIVLFGTLTIIVLYGKIRSGGNEGFS